MFTIKCLRSYKRLPISDLPEFAEGVEDGIYDNSTIFVSPPFPQADFKTLITEYVAKRGTYVNGGSAQKPAWNTARTKLIDALDDTADYVDTLVNGDENVVILAGYKPSKPYASSTSEPNKITGVKLTRNEEKQSAFIADCQSQSNINCYVCVLTESAPLPAEVFINDSGRIALSDIQALATSTGEDTDENGITGIYIDFNQNRKKMFENMKPLKTYYCVYFGINAGGVGSMSDPESIVCV